MMLADLKEFLRAAKTFMETKHRLLAALLNGRPAALDYAETARKYQAKFEMFCRVNSVAIIHAPASQIPCPSCRATGRNTSLLSDIELHPQTIEFWSALLNQTAQMRVLTGRCEECGELLIAADEPTIRRLFCGFAGDRWWFINSNEQSDPIVVKNWATSL